MNINKYIKPCVPADEESLVVSFVRGCPLRPLCMDGLRKCRIGGRVPMYFTEMRRQVATKVASDNKLKVTMFLHELIKSR